MQSIKIHGHEFTTIASLKAFATEHGIIPAGNKSFKQTWVDAIESYMEVQAEVVAMAIEAEESAIEASETIENAAVSAGSLIVAAVTSEPAIEFYRGTLKFIVFTLIITWMFTIAAVKWLWSHRRDAAVYHWIADWLDSQSGKTAMTHCLIAEWIIRQWVEVLTDRWDELSRSVREYASKILGRAGLA